MINARAATIMMPEGEGGSLITWSPACAKKGACGSAQVDELPAMCIDNAVSCPCPHCTDWKLQMANTGIEIPCE